MRASSGKVLGLLLLLAVIPPALRAAEQPSITASFAAFWPAAEGKSFARQEQLWEREIEAPHRDVYDSVVWETKHDPHWQARRQRWLQARFALYPTLAAGIPGEVHALQDALAKQSVRFKTLFSDADAHPPVRILLAPNFDAKSGVLGNGSPVLVFAADSLLLEQAKLDILLPHELFHLYHAQHAGIRNDGVMPGATLTLPLFEEGLATYVSSLLAPRHTDGELLLQDDLGAIPSQRLAEIARRFLVDAQAKAIDAQHPETFARWFNSSKKPYQPDLPNRAGYWLGLQLIRRMRHRHSLAAMAAWSPSQAQAHTLQALQDMAAAQ